MGKRWQNYEKQFLKDNFYKKGAKWCSKNLLGRTIYAVQLQAHRLYIKGNRGQNFKDLTGNIYGDLEVMERGEDYISPKRIHQVQWWCKCKCGNWILVQVSSLIGNLTTSCGCLRNEKARERFTKENHYNWKGGISKLSCSIRNCDKNLKWKKDCRERDNYTCRKCGKKGDSRFPVHHCRTPFWKILETLIANGITDVNDIPDDSEFWNIGNGVTLCEDCHKEFHSIYGNDFIKEDFEKWLNQIFDNLE